MRSGKVLSGLFVLAFCVSLASAQLVGLPEVGVTLSGTPGDPIIENHSPQVVIGHVLRVFYANSAIPTNASNFKAREIWLNRGSGLQPNQREVPLSRILSHGQMWVNGIHLQNPTRVVLDSVVFADGRVAGPDVINNFGRLSEHLKTLKELAALVHGARQNHQLDSAVWSEVDRIRMQKGPAWPLALDLYRAHSSADHTTAFDIADRVATLPTLWRAK